jgi:hypothetical protein
LSGVVASSIHDHIIPLWDTTAQASPNIAFIKYQLAKLGRLTARFVLGANLSLADVFFPANQNKQLA